MPKSGTFIIRPTSLTNGGSPLGDVNNPGSNFLGWYIDYSVDPNNTILKCLQATDSIQTVRTLRATLTSVAGSNSFVDTIRFDTYFGQSIYLDGSNTPVSYSNLPVAFVPTSAVLKVNLISIQQPGTGSTQFFLQQAQAYEGILNASSFIYSPISSMLSILTNGIGIRINEAQTFSVQGGCDVEFENLRIEGTYSLVKYSCTLETPPSLPATGTPITITSNFGLGSSGGKGTGSGSGKGIAVIDSLITPLNLLNASQINITYYDNNNVLQTIVVPTSSFTAWTSNIITFLLPDITGPQPKAITIVYVDNGQQFSGSLTLGQLATIYFTDGTGIYVLKVGKRTDTLYVQGTRQTVEVNIPNPFIKTGFVP